MKALKILAIIFGVIALLLTFAPIMRDLSLASEIKELSALGSFGDALGLPSVGQLYAALFVAVLLTVVVIVGIIFAIKQNPKLKRITYLIFALAILSIFIHPSFKASMRSASPREIAVFHAIPAMLVALFLLLFSNKMGKVNSSVDK